jgi:hypothetical protein
MLYRRILVCLACLDRNGQLQQLQRARRTAQDVSQAKSKGLRREDTMMMSGHAVSARPRHACCFRGGCQTVVQRQRQVPLQYRYIK